MSWILFDEQGNRAQKLTWWRTTGTVTRGWIADRAPHPVLDVTPILGFIPERTWRPTYFAAKMAKGYRVFELDVGVHEYVDAKQLSDWWQPATQIAYGRQPPVSEKRLPTMAAVEMWVRHQAARDG